MDQWANAASQRWDGLAMNYKTLGNPGLLVWELCLGFANCRISILLVFLGQTLGRSESSAARYRLEAYLHCQHRIRSVNRHFFAQLARPVNRVDNFHELNSLT
jgi:uncharacterized membrane protein